jgi:hypothetical protein
MNLPFYSEQVQFQSENKHVEYTKIMFAIKYKNQKSKFLIKRN